MSTTKSSKLSLTCISCRKKYEAWPSAKRRFCSHVCATKHQRQKVEERFWLHVQKTESCWVWTAHRNNNGYGLMRVGYGINRATVSVHRLSWKMHNGEPPPGKCVLHKCDNPPCVNPDHLFLGTHRDNTQDMIRKGRRGYTGRSKAR